MSKFKVRAVTDGRRGVYVYAFEVPQSRLVYRIRFKNQRFEQEMNVIDVESISFQDVGGLPVCLNEIPKVTINYAETLRKMIELRSK